MKIKTGYKYIALIVAVFGALILKNTLSSYSMTDNENNDSSNVNIVSDTDYSIEITCPETANNGDTISCELYASGSAFGGVEATITYDGLTQTNFQGESNWPYAGINNGKLVAVSSVDADGKTKIGTLTLTVNDNSSMYKTVTVTNGKIFKITDETFQTSDTTTTVRNPNTDNNLVSLSLSNGDLSPSFSATVTSYSATVDASSITISATGPLGSTVKGTGEKTLNYGENIFNIVVTSETGSQKTYIVTINRTDNRSTNTNLSSVTLSSGTIEFKQDVTLYDISIPSASSTFNISGIAEDTKSTITYPQGQSLTLNYGETKTLTIVVTSEKGTAKTYTFNVTRTDDRSTNANLSSVTLSSGTIEFKQDVTLYNISIPSASSTFNISGVAEDSKSTITYPQGQSLTLNYGETKTLTIVVTSEKGTTKTYTFNITRTDDRSTNNNLKSLKISNATISFDKNKTSYTVNVENNIDSVTISGDKEDDKAIVVGLGKKSLKVGSNVFKITVTSESGSTKTYIITIIRKTAEGEVPTLSNNANIKNITINGVDLSLITNQDTYTVSVKNSVTTADIKYTLEDEKSSAIFEGDTNLIVGMNIFKITVTAEDGTTKTYQIYLERKEEQKIVNNNTESIIEEIKTGDNNIITITVNYSEENKTIDQSILDELKNTDKTLIYEVVDDNNGLLYSVTVSSKDVKTSESIDLNLDFNEDETLKLTENNVKYLNFKNSGSSTTNLTTKIFVGDKFKNGDVLTLSEYDVYTKKFQTIKTNILVQDGYITFESDKLSNYILSSSTLNLANNIGTSKLIFILILIAIVVTLVVIVFIMRKKNKNNRNSDKGMVSPIDNNDSIYNPSINRDIFDQQQDVEILDVNNNVDIIDKE